MVDNFFRLPVLYRVKTGFDDQLDGAAALLSHSVQQRTTTTRTNQPITDECLAHNLAAAAGALAEQPGALMCNGCLLAPN